MIDLRCGDALAMLPTIESGSIDAIVTDPPWKNYETGWYDAGGHHSPVAYLSPDRYAAEFFRVLRDDSACILWCDWRTFDPHASALRDAGFAIKNCIVWPKPNHTAGDLDGNLGNQHEMAVFATKGRWKRRGRREVNVWQEPHLFTKTKRNHPTEKPLRLMTRAVKCVSKPGDVVLDPFAGSGTTLVACMKTGRNAIGVEIDDRYIPVIRSRLIAAETPLLSTIEAAPPELPCLWGDQ
jgi:site-specific DNA-methyltransferase (adenine-specific)